MISAYLTNNLGNTTGGVIKLDTFGNILWGKELSATLGLGSITINDVVAGHNDEIVIAGNIEGPEDFIGAIEPGEFIIALDSICLLYTSPSPRDATLSRMPSSA